MKPTPVRDGCVMISTDRGLPGATVGFIRGGRMHLGSPKNPISIPVQANLIGTRYIYMTPERATCQCFGCKTYRTLRRIF